MSVKGHIFLTVVLCCAVMCFGVVIRLAVVDCDVGCCWCILWAGQQPRE